MYGRARWSERASIQRATRAAAIVPSTKLSPASKKPETWSGVIRLLLRGSTMAGTTRSAGPRPGSDPDASDSRWTASQRKQRRLRHGRGRRRSPAAVAPNGPLDHRERAAVPAAAVPGRAGPGRLPRRPVAHRRHDSASPFGLPAEILMDGPAARRPAATASMIVFGPETTSPPANTPLRPVASVRASATMPAAAADLDPGADRQDRRVRLLADGHQDRRGRPVSRAAGNGSRDRAPAIELAGGSLADDAQAGHESVETDNPVTPTPVRISIPSRSAASTSSCWAGMSAAPAAINNA